MTLIPITTSIGTCAINEVKFSKNHQYGQPKKSLDGSTTRVLRNKNMNKLSAEYEQNIYMWTLYNCLDKNVGMMWMSNISW